MKDELTQEEETQLLGAGFEDHRGELWFETDTKFLRVFRFPNYYSVLVAELDFGVLEEEKAYPFPSFAEALALVKKEIENALR